MSIHASIAPTAEILARLESVVTYLRTVVGAEDALLKALVLRLEGMRAGAPSLQAGVNAVRPFRPRP